MERRELAPGTALVLEQGDITRADVDAIVNAANRKMLGGGGVDGAIHRAAGPELLEACRELPEVEPGGRCPTGEARITPGFRLPARWVIHAVGPVYKDAETSAPLLRAVHEASLALAREKGLRSIAFPAIACGVYGYPPGEAAPIAIAAARDGASGLEEVRFVLFDRATYDVWTRAAEELLGG